MFSIDNLINGIEKIFRHTKIFKDEENLVLYRNLTGDISARVREYPKMGNICLSNLDDILKILSNDFAFNDFFLYNDEYFEVPVKPQDPFRYSPRFFEKEQYLVEEHGYKLVTSKASVGYISALLCYVGVNSEKNWEYFSIVHRMLKTEGITSLEDLTDNLHIQTIKIYSQNSCSISEFKKFLNSYIFNIAYNNNVVLNITNFFEERKIFWRSVRRDGQLFPYNSYNMELVKYYYQAISSDIPFAQYLAYYHVAEYFFQIIAESDAFQTIENLITHPSFSPRRKEDIRQFYKKIKKVMKDQKEDGVWDEKVGLLLCLKKYIPDIKSLENAIKNIDITAIEYYKSNDVPFATDTKNEKDKIRINFDDTEEALYANIRNRIYLVRNAIAHSKEGEHLRYEPFKHDKELFKEIPLIRAVAEEIIINSAKPIDIKK